MDFKVDRKSLVEALAVASKVCVKVESMPILSHARLDVSDGTLTVTARDLEMGARLSIKAEIAKDGVAVVPVANLYSFLSASQSGEVAFSLTRALRVSVQCGGARILVPSLDPDKFSISTVEEPELRLSGAYSALKSALTSTMFASESAGDDMRMVTKAIWFHSAGSMTRAVGTNQHRLSIAPIVGLASGDWRLIMPRKMAAALLSLKLIDDIPFSLMENERQVVVEFPGIRLESRKLSGSVPDFDRVSGVRKQLIGSLPVTEARERFSQAQIVGGDVRLTAAKGGGFELSAIGGDGEFSGSIEGKAEMDLSAVVNPAYVNDFLKLATGAMVELYEEKDARVIRQGQSGGFSMPKSLHLIDGERHYVLQPIAPNKAEVAA